MECIVILAVICVLVWWHSMTNPNYPEFPNSWNPSDGPESEDELEDNLSHTKV